MAAGKARDCVFEQRGVGLGTYFRGIHDFLEAHGVQARLVVRLCEGDVRGADVKKVGPESAYELLDGYLEEAAEGGCPQCAHDGVAGIPGGFDSGLGKEVYYHGDGDGQEAREPGGQYPATVGIRPFWIDDVSGAVEGDGESSDDDIRGVVYLGIEVSFPAGDTDRFEGRCWYILRNSRHQQPTTQEYQFHSIGSTLRRRISHHEET